MFSRTMEAMCCVLFILVWMVLLHSLRLDREGPVVLKDEIELVFCGLTLGLAAGILDGWRLAKKQRGKNLRASWYVLAFVAAGLIYGVALAVFFEDAGDRAADAVFSSLFLVLVVGLIFCVRGKNRTMTEDIQSVETINWSWKPALRRGSWSLAIPLGALGIIWLLHYLYAWHLGRLTLQFRIDWFDWRNVLRALGMLGFLYVAMITVPISLFAGMKRGILQTKSLPNQGIKLSVRRAMWACSLIGISVCLLGAGGGRLLDKLSVGSAVDTSGALGDPMLWMFLASSFGSIAGMVYGGLDVIQHYTLRGLMRFEGYIPFHFVPFLEHAVGLVFLQRAGGGYIFVHRSLLEHFAHLNSKSSIVVRQHEAAQAL